MAVSENLRSANGLPAHTHLRARSPSAEGLFFDPLHPECGGCQTCGRVPHTLAGASPTGVRLCVAAHTKADSTLRSSRAVPHPSTNRALRRLTSEVRRDPVHSTRYGRQRKDCQCSALDGPRVCGAGSFFAGGHAASIAPELFWPSEVKRRMARLERG